MNEHAAGKITLPLEVPDAFYQASIEAGSGDGVRFCVELADTDASASTTLRAVSLLLLLTTGRVRLVRAACRNMEDRVVFGLEAWLASGFCLEEVVRALSALSIACAMCGREVGVLQDETIARQYLEWQNRNC